MASWLYTVTVAGLIGCVAVVYGSVGQAGGTAFLAVMAFADFSSGEIRPTALALNIVAAGYATWQLQQRAAIDWRMVRLLAIPSLPLAYIGGRIALKGSVYFVLTGAALLVAGGLMVIRVNANSDSDRSLAPLAAVCVGAAAGLLSGLTGVGGGVFLVPQLILFGWASAKDAAAISPPFIACNSISGFAGTLGSGQTVAPEIAAYCIAALIGAVLGTNIAGRISERIARYVLAGILMFAGIRLIFR
jgi:uncharacterized protein